MHAPSVFRPSVYASLLLILLPLLTPAAASAQLTRLGPFEVGGLSPGHPGVAFDSRSSDDRPAPVFLVVSGSGTITGRFVRADGSFAGAAFQVNTASTVAQTPAVASNPDGTFLVAWVESRESAAPDV